MDVSVKSQNQWDEHVLEREIQKMIRKYFCRIEKELDVRAISGDLVSAEVLDFDQKQEIDSKDTSKAANTVLATYLHQNADSAKLEGFLTVLESDTTHPKHRKLAKDMRNDLRLAQSLVGIAEQQFIQREYTLYTYIYMDYAD